MTLNNVGVPWEVAREEAAAGAAGATTAAGASSVLARVGLTDMAECRPCRFKPDDVKRYMPNVMKIMDPDPVTEDVSTNTYFTTSS